MKIQIKKLNPNIPDIKPAHVGEWMDLYCAEDISLRKGKYHQVRLGVCIKLPEGYEGWLTSRSSMVKKFGILHCDDLGVIDNSYCGDNDEWMLPVLAVKDTDLHVGDRICQFRIHEIQPEIEIEYVEQMDAPDRGGIGSTGTGELETEE